MGVEIKSEHIDISGKSVILVSVRGGRAILGTCSAGYGFKRGDTASQTRLFYLGKYPVAEIICPNHGSKRSDKMISLCTGYAGMDDDIHNTLTECFEKLNRGDSLEAGLHEVFGMLADGVYAVYYSDYYTTDGAGAFFWGAYNLSHEVHGTAEHSRIIGLNRTYRPCFLVPGTPLDDFEAKKLSATDVAVKARACQGIVYQLSGLHSVLLKGHHGAVSCTMNKIPFKCAVIEKINEPYIDAAPAAPTAPADAAAQQQEAAEAPAEKLQTAEAVQEGITGFRSASVKIPLGLMPRDMLRNVLENRFEYKPEHYYNLLKKMSTVRKKSFSNKIIPAKALEICEDMPDSDMMESVFAVDKLTQAQLDTLLLGETEYNGEIIISPNFYSSIVTACSYLQFTNPKKFIEFSLAILDNPELNATHEYIANRIARINSKEIYGFFRAVYDNGGIGYEKILPIAEKYIDYYEKNAEQ